MESVKDAGIVLAMFLNNSLDRSGRLVFRINPSAGKLALARGAAQSNSDVSRLKKLRVSEQV